MSRSVVRQARRIVVKVGSSLVTAEGRGLDHLALARWAEQIAALTAQGREVVLVSSGAIAEGIARLGWKKRPKAVNELQAAAAIGQTGVVQAYESIFRTYGLHAAQVLLTHEDLVDRTRYLNARSTLRTLLELRAVPPSGAPRSLGLVDPRRPTTLLRTQLLRDTAAFAVSVEPAGGSPTGAPTPSAPPTAPANAPPNASG